MFDEKKRPYRTFVLRCWRAEGDADGGVGEWRYALQEVPNGEYWKAATSLEELLVDLEMELARGAYERPDGPNQTAAQHREAGCSY